MQALGMAAQGYFLLLHGLSSEAGVNVTPQLNTLNTPQKTLILCRLFFFFSLEKD